MKLARKIKRKLFHLSFPHEGNNFKARLLHPSGFFFLKIALIAFQLVLQFVIFSPFPKILGYAANISPQEVIRLANEKRTQLGLTPLEENPTLSQAALAKGTHMIENDYWAHVAPDGTQPWTFFVNSGYKYRYAGENLARDFSNPSSAIDAWMASPSHKENLLSTKYKDIGIAVVEGELAGVETTIIVQFFGSKYADTLPVEPIAEAKKTLQQIATPTPVPATAVVESPTPVPMPEVKIVQAPEAGVSGEHKVLVSPFNTTKEVSLAVVGILLTVLVVDAAVTSRRRIKRIGGRTLAHIAFLGMITAIALILKAGQII